MKLFLVLLAAVVMTACGTPQAVMDQAKLGAAMETELGKSYSNYKTVIDNMAADRQQVLTMRRQQAADAMNSLGPLKFASQTLSKDAGQAERRAIKKLGDMADVIDKQETTAVSIAKMSPPTLALTPLPLVSDKTLVAQKAFAEMGDEQPIMTRLSEYGDFYNTVKKGIDDNKKKIEDSAQKARNQ